MCAQRRLRSAWASAQDNQSSLCAKWVAKDPSFLHADSEENYFFVYGVWASLFFGLWPMVESSHPYPYYSSLIVATYDQTDWADAQGDPSLHWAHSHFIGFVMSQLKYIFHKTHTSATCDTPTLCVSRQMCEQMSKVLWYISRSTRQQVN